MCAGYYLFLVGNKKNVRLKYNMIYGLTFKRNSTYNIKLCQYIYICTVEFYLSIC